MPDNTNVNNNASVVVVGRTAPVPPGQQKSDKSVPVVIASDQSTIPVAEQNKVSSEVALSLLGIPRSEVALGIFADVNTYDVNPTEWAAEPDQFSSVSNTGVYAGVKQNMNWGLSHVPEESGALLEAPADRTAILTSKRFFRYQPGRVSAATFGVKTTVFDPTVTDTVPSALSDDQKEFIGQTVYNPAIRKYGIFDNFDGYYWETRNNGQGDNFCVVRRTQSLLVNNPVEFSATATPSQTADLGATNPLDVTAPRGNETDDDKDENSTNNFGGTYQSGHDSTPDGFKNVKLGDLCIYRDNLLMTHAGVYDPSLLQDEQEYAIESSDTATDILTFDVSETSGVTAIGKSITNAVYDIDTGLMTVTTSAPHGFADGKFVNLSGIGMTCRYSFANGDGTGTLLDGSGGAAGNKDLRKVYPDRTHGYNIIRVDSTTSFTVNVGVSTVPTFFNADKSRESGAVVIGLSTSQYISYCNKSTGQDITGLTNEKIYRVNDVTYRKNTSGSTVTVDGNDFADGEYFKKVDISVREVTVPMPNNYDAGATYTANNVNLTTVPSSNSSLQAKEHVLKTPVPFVQPQDQIIRLQPNGAQIRHYGSVSVKRSGMFPYMYKDTEAGTSEGYIDTTLGVSQTEVSSLKTQIESLNKYYRNWVNQNVKKDFWNVYEYRVPRSRFSGDRLDNATDDLLFSDVTATNRAGSSVIDTTTGGITQDTSIWNLEFDKVTMYKVEFSWYGAVGALFLAYVPVGNGEARWVRVHHLRASNQLKGSSLGNATLPITYLVYGGGSLIRGGYTNANRKETSFQYGSTSEHIIKYGASYYIDGGDRGTVKLFSHGTPTEVSVFGSKRTFNIGSLLGGNSNVISIVDGSANNQQDPFITLDTGNTVGQINSSFLVGAKVLTGNPLDQNIEVVYVDTANRKVHLNTPLNSPLPSTNITFILNRPTPLVGLKCRDFIRSSTGQDVRNRTQVYPTRLSTGNSTKLIKIDLLKSPIFQTSSAKSGTFTLPANPDPTDLTKTALNIGKRGKAFKIHTSTQFNYFTNNNSGAYGYLRGQFEGDSSNKKISVFGYLERRESASDYYFRAEESTSENILLDGGSVFLYEDNLNPKGEANPAVDNDFTLDALSSIKVSPELRAPIPKTGTIVASLFISTGGTEFDLSPYFDFNKEYLSFPLTNVVESLFVVGSSEEVYASSTEVTKTNASVTWEEQ